MPNRLTGGEAQVGSLRLIGGAAIKQILIADVMVNPAAINAATKAGVEVVVPGAEVGDIVIVNPPATLEAGLLFTGARVTDADEVTIDLYNPTGGQVNGADLAWSFLLIREG